MGCSAFRWNVGGCAWFAAFAAMVAMGCAEDGAEGGTGGTEPSVSFAEPNNGSTIRTKLNAVDISAIVTPVNLASSDKVEMLLDNVAVGFASGDGAYVFTNVTLGIHTLGARVVDGIGTPYPGANAAASISITISKIACEADAECNDDNECTEDRCNDGVCVNQGIPGCSVDSECQTAADCSNKNAAPPACKAWACVPVGGKGVCEVQNVPNGAACNDGDACTSGDSCQAGECTGTALDCDDNNACTDDTCNSSSGCVNSPNAAACDDGNACTQNDTCAEGACQGSAISCDDGVDCTVDSCAPASGCVNTPDDAACDDDNVCTDDSCNAATGCVAAPNAAACDDSDACTEGDYCEAGACVPGNNVCGCQTTPDCAVAEDGNACNGTLICVNKSCVVDPATVITCEDDGNSCTSVACVPATGECAVTNLEGIACTDGNACTQGDVCSGGSCTGAAVTCNDNNACTDDSCNPSTGCVFTNNSASCDDGSACTQGEACVAGACTGTAVVCNDNNPCTDDSCNAATGCVFTNNTAACDDGDACTVGDMCSGGSCAPGNNTCQCQDTADCAGLEDGNLCNGTLICQNNQCVVNPSTVVNCQQDNNPCTNNQCQPATGQCQVVNVNGVTCSDNNACTSGDVCQGGSCVGTAVNTDDGNPCTDDSCDPATGVKHTPNSAACNDNNACTQNDTCSGGTCGGSPVVCNDNNVCTNDSCNPATGCVYTNNSATCDDGDPCTAGDMCSGGVCVGGNNTCQCQNTADCASAEDGNACNGTLICVSNQCVVDPATIVTCAGGVTNCQVQACNPATGTCQPSPAPNGTSCSDNDACTTGDVCQAGTCTGTALTCNDNNPCTTDSCNPMSGCVFSPSLGAPCDDGNPCTQGDACTQSGCVGSTPTICNDNNPCTTDSCNPASGCVFAPSSGQACDDGDPCTTLDVCDNGVCKSPNPPCFDNNQCTDDVCVAGVGCSNPAKPSSFCNDGNPCTIDSCNPTSGCVFAPNNGAACNDGNACTNNDVCNASTCAGSPITCNDNNPCTVDSCNPATGCTATPAANGSPCNDGNACTTNDACQAGVCTGASLNCDDGNVCTADSCNPSSGCVNAPLSDVPCNDGDSCTDIDSCKNGACVGTGLAPECQLPDSVCTVFGNAGELYTCTLLLARATQATALPAGLTFELVYPAAQLQPMQFQDEDCGAAVCVTKPVPPAALWPTGHTLLATPSNVSAWFGQGKVEIMHPTAPATAINQAYFDAGGALQGNAAFVQFQILLVADIPSASPVAVVAQKAFGVSASGMPMQVVQNLNVLTVSDALPDCTLYPAQCDDGIACTVDGCNQVTKTCTNTATNALCEDGIACTANVCNAATGCVSTPNNSLCNDNNQCTADACVVGIGCTNAALPAGAPCNDGNLCTVNDSCNAAGACTAGPAANCDDGNVCTNDSCNPNTGCVYTNANGLPCDDFNQCTSGDSCTAGVCAGNPVGGPGCDPPSELVLCELVGNAGTEVECKLGMVACNNTVPKATAMQFTLSWDSTVASIINFYDDICFGTVGCFTLPVTGTGSQPLSTGHTMSIAPNPIGGWNGLPCISAAQCGGAACVGSYCVGTEAEGGFGAVVAVNLSNPSAAFSVATLNGEGQIVGDSQVAKIRFKMLQSTTAANPLELFIDQLLTTDASSLALESSVSKELVTTCGLKQK